jgi:hypothetical protein
MVATHEPAAVNRVAGYFQKPLPEIPTDDFGRQAFYTEAILQAVAAIRGLLNSNDQAIVLKAAQELFALERTRLRHKLEITGCREKPIPKWKLDQEKMEALNDPGPPSPGQLEREAVDAHGKEAQAELRKAEEAKPANERKKVHSQAGRALVARCLKEWKITARSIPAGGFWREYLQRPVPAKTVERSKPTPDRKESPMDFYRLPRPMA